MAQVLRISDYQAALEAAVRSERFTPDEAANLFNIRLNGDIRNGLVSFQSACAESQRAQKRFLTVFRTRNLRRAYN